MRLTPDRQKHDDGSGRTGMHILGVVLAGGRATRMGGIDKASIPFAGATLLDATIRRFGPQTDELIINANGDATRFARFGLPVVADGLSGYPGPLAGLLAAMDHAARTGFTHVASVPVDTPFLPIDLVARLKEAVETGMAPIALAATNDEDSRLARQPVFGLWPVDLREDLRGALAEGISKIMVWAERHGVGFVTFTADGIDPFFNVNTPADIKEAERLAALSRPRPATSP